MGEVTLTDVKYLSPVGVAGPLELAFWADYVDPDYLKEFGPIASVVAVFCFIWCFIMPMVHRTIERRVQDKQKENQEGIPFCIAELGLIWPLIGVLGVVFAMGFAVTANSRVCMLCATGAENVRGFGGNFCPYVQELKDALNMDNSTKQCIFVKESIFGPGRRTWISMASGDQMNVTTQQIERKFTGVKGIHTLWIHANNESESDAVFLVRLEQNSTTPVSPFNETYDGLRIFADNKSEPLDFAGALGWGNGKIYMRASRETVQLIVYRHDEMVCAFLGAMGVAILISVPWMETCEFNVVNRKVNRERYFLVPMSWMIPTNTGLAALDMIKYAWFQDSSLMLKIRAGTTQVTNTNLREMSEEHGLEEVRRIQRFLFSIGVEVELTAEEKDNCLQDIIPPRYIAELPAEELQSENKGLRNRGKAR